MSRPVLAVSGGIVGVWALSLYPAYRIGGREMVWASSAAAVLSWLPAVVIVLWDEWLPPTTPEGRLRRMALATGLRMIVVLGGSFTLYLGVPGFQSLGFWVWVLVFYLIALALETTRVPLQAI